MGFSAEDRILEFVFHYRLRCS